MTSLRSSSRILLVVSSKHSGFLKIGRNIKNFTGASLKQTKCEVPFVLLLTFASRECRLIA